MVVVDFILPIDVLLTAMRGDHLEQFGTVLFGRKIDHTLLLVVQPRAVASVSVKESKADLLRRSQSRQKNSPEQSS